LAALVAVVVPELEPELELDELLEPHAAITTSPMTTAGAASHLFLDFISILLSQKNRASICDRKRRYRTVNPSPTQLAFASMEVRVRLFASLRERVGSDELVLELPEGARVADALDRLRSVTDGVPAVMAVNREYADLGAALHEGDEVALIPPVSGGAIDSLHARVTDQPIALEPLIERVRDPRAGAVVSFQGVTREVAELRYEAYVEMAEAQIAEIVARAIERHGLCAAAAEHRVGTVPLSEPSVLVAVSAPHRDAAFAGAREIIDEIKARAPIWKKEEGEWVSGTTPAPAR
jgi:molybdopterin synthase catalytic subunit